MAINFLIGRKMGMTRIFDNLGSDFPVTILKAGPCSVTQIKTFENNGMKVVVNKKSYLLKCLLIFLQEYLLYSTGAKNSFLESFALVDLIPIFFGIAKV